MEGALRYLPILWMVAKRHGRLECRWSKHFHAHSLYQTTIRLEGFADFLWETSRLPGRASAWGVRCICNVAALVRSSVNKLTIFLNLYVSLRTRQNIIGLCAGSLRFIHLFTN